MVSRDLVARSGGMDTPCLRDEADKSANLARLRRVGLHQAVKPHQFTERPRLEWRAAGNVRGVAIGDFGNVIETCVVQMLMQGRKKALPRLFARGAI